MKTLKDIEVTIQDSPKETYKIVHSDKLREWAREWLDKICKDMDIKSKDINNIYLNKEEILTYTVPDEWIEKYKENRFSLHSIAWIKHFFNLEDEE